uniref:Uncharacterized protein n=1 Tax=Octopus bimaculoides TaxID=37653 RepID=A0A0L8GGF8_OCTBM
MIGSKKRGHFAGIFLFLHLKSRKIMRKRMSKIIKHTSQWSSISSVNKRFCGLYKHFINFVIYLELGTAL